MGLPRGLRLALLVYPFLVGAAAADPASEIAAAHKSFEDAFNSQDAAGVAAHFTEDAIALSPGWNVVEGRDGIETMYTAFLEAGFHDLESTPVTLDFINDDVAVEVFLHTSHRTAGDGARKEHFFKVLDVWQRDEDGSWRIYRTSFNPRPGEQ